jgi:signal transduction histidine kinase
VVARTGIAIRNFSNIVSAEGLYLGLVEDIKRISRRILAKLDHTLDVSGEEFIEQLEVHTQVDLFLFYKESLMNICRHSDATRASTQLTGTAQEIVLTISDNGKGLAEQNIPAALKRRAKFLKAKLTVEEDPEGGTSIRLRLRKRRGLIPRPARNSK